MHINMYEQQKRDCKLWKKRDSNTNGIGINTLYGEISCEAAEKILNAQTRLDICMYGCTQRNPIHD